MRLATNSVPLYKVRATSEQLARMGAWSELLRAG